MSIRTKDRCVLVTSRSLEHNDLFKILNAFYNLYGVDIEFETLCLDPKHEYASSDDYYQNLLSELGNEYKALHIDDAFKNRFIKHVDFYDDSVLLTNNTNLVINNLGMKTAFNTDVYGISASINNACDGNNRITSFDKAVIMGNCSSVSSAIVSCAEKQIDNICLLSENHAGKENPYVIANKNGINVQPLPYVVPAIVKDFLSDADLIITYLDDEENTHWKSLYNAKKHSVTVQMLSDRYPSNFVMESMKNASIIVSPFTVLFHQAFMSVKIILGDIFKEDTATVKKKVFELAFK